MPKSGRLWQPGSPRLSREDLCAQSKRTLSRSGTFRFPVPPREQLAPGLRVTFHSPYAIYYKPLADAVVIIRVIRGARDVTAQAKRGGFG